MIDGCFSTENILNVCELLKKNVRGFLFTCNPHDRNSFKRFGLLFFVFTEENEPKP